MHPAVPPDAHALHGGWQIGRVHAGDTAPREWLPIPALQPVAAALRERGEWQLDGPERDFDLEGWAYRLVFDRPAWAGKEAGAVLGLDGLATVCSVSLNGTQLLHSENMFTAHRLPVGELLRPQGNELVLHFHALAPLLEARRPRPRWRVPMLRQQQLRWWRTTLLGRTPGWSPPAAVLGPWRGAWLAPGLTPEVNGLRLQTQLAGPHATLHASGHLRLPPGVTAAGARIELRRGGQRTSAALEAAPGGNFTAVVQLENAALWWPHTHGEPACYDACITTGGPAPLHIALPTVGLRQIECDTSGGGFKLRVNGVPVFCRGACWTPLDPVTLHAPAAQYDAAVAQVCAAGMNMLRVGGTMVYEADAFYDACDRQGVLVWQDFMFANMDYPADDAAFKASVHTEVQQQLARWQGRPSIAVLCGNSEVEQQAAMWGAPREQWQPALFHQDLPAWCASALPGTPYWPSSAHGGAFPFQADAGTSSYYGVGAYLRPPTDARHSGLRFATECLAFAQVPEPAALARMPGGRTVRSHHAAWKARSPRDLGAGWDFDDVRDHYTAQLFGVDVAALRYSDPERYLMLSRVASASVSAAAFSEWRRAGSVCGGALVWFLRDLWAGAGWGLLDECGGAKAAWHCVSRVLQPVALLLADEGVNGLMLHAVNDTGAPVQAELDVGVWRGEARNAHATQTLTLAPHSSHSLAVASLFEHFMDLSYAYRFGPPAHDATIATLRVAGHDQGPGPGAVQSQALHLPLGLRGACHGADPRLHARIQRQADGSLQATVGTHGLALAVHFDVDGYAADDAYFDLAPGAQRSVTLRPLGSAAPRAVRGTVAAVNAPRPVLPELLELPA